MSACLGPFAHALTLDADAEASTRAQNTHPQRLQFLHTSANPPKKSVSQHNTAQHSPCE